MACLTQPFGVVCSGTYLISKLILPKVMHIPITVLDALRPQDWIVFG
jgi:hypothetical protein